MSLVMQNSGDLDRWINTWTNHVASLAVRDALRLAVTWAAELRGLGYGDDWGDFLGEASVWIHHYGELLCQRVKAPAVLVDVVEREPSPATSPANISPDTNVAGGSPLNLFGVRRVGEFVFFHVEDGRPILTTAAANLAAWLYVLAETTQTDFFRLVRDIRFSQEPSF